MAFLGLAATTDSPIRSAAALALEVLPRSATANVESALKELGQTLPQKESAVNETDIEDRPDLNTGNKWSELDLFALAKQRLAEHPIEEIESQLIEDLCYDYN